MITHWENVVFILELKWLYCALTVLPHEWSGRLKAWTSSAETHPTFPRHRLEAPSCAAGAQGCRGCWTSRTCVPLLRAHSSCLLWKMPCPCYSSHLLSSRHPVVTQLRASTGTKAEKAKEVCFSLWISGGTERRLRDTALGKIPCPAAHINRAVMEEMEPCSPTRVWQDETLQLKAETRVRLDTKSNLLSMRAGRQRKKSSRQAFAGGFQELPRQRLE